MIIELLGPPAVGKTTLARALGAALAESGAIVEVITSVRPAERSGQSADWLSRLVLAAPLMRAAKLVTALPMLRPRSNATETAALLLDLLPPRKLANRVRYRRYLSMLDASRKRARDASWITIFEQGYVAALSSLVLLGNAADREEHLAAALAILPRADLLICLDAPQALLRERLALRLGHQSALERIFELDLETNLKQREIVLELTDLLVERAWPILRVDCIDQAASESAVAAILARISPACSAHRCDHAA